MDTLQKMRIFVRVISSGSFTLAAQSLDTTTGAASRAVSELEEHLRARLLNRSTRKLSLTNAGERYLQRCKAILADIERAEEEASDFSIRPVGTLRVQSFASIGQRYVLPVLAEYRQQYPDVAVELEFSQHLPALADGASDVAVVAASALPDSEMISALLGTTYSILCASPGYVSKHGAPMTPLDLQNHDCLTLNLPTISANDWILENSDSMQAVRVKSVVKMNVADALVSATISGMGIGVLPLFTALDGLRTGALTRILGDFTLQKLNIYAIHPSRRFVDAKTRTWIDCLQRRLPRAILKDNHELQSYCPSATHQSGLSSNNTEASPTALTHTSQPRPNVH